MEAERSVQRARGAVRLPHFQEDPARTAAGERRESPLDEGAPDAAAMPGRRDGKVQNLGLVRGILGDDVSDDPVRRRRDEEHHVGRDAFPEVARRPGVAEGRLFDRVDRRRVGGLSRTNAAAAGRGGPPI